MAAAHDLRKVQVIGESHAGKWNQNDRDLAMHDTRIALENIENLIAKWIKDQPQPQTELEPNPYDSTHFHYRDARTATEGVTSLGLLIAACATAGTGCAVPAAAAGLACGAACVAEEAFADYPLRKKIAEKMGLSRSSGGGFLAGLKACPGRVVGAIANTFGQCRGLILDKKNAKHFVTGSHQHDYKGNEISEQDMPNYTGATCQTVRGAAGGSIGLIACAAGLAVGANPVAWALSGGIFAGLGFLDVQECFDRRFKISAGQEKLSCWGSFKQGVGTICICCHATRMGVTKVAMGSHESLPYVNEQPTLGEHAVGVSMRRQGGEAGEAQSARV